MNARRFAVDTSGATAIEYVGIMVVVAQISGSLNGIFAQLTGFVGG